MDEASQRAFDVEIRLRSLATDILEHEGCKGCRINAAQALEFVGTLEETRERLGIEDPRELQRRQCEEHQRQAAASRPPHLRLSLEAEIILTEPSEDLQNRVSSAVADAVWAAVGGISGASILGHSAAIRMDSP
jgi:hypothetical protein